jgi:hypothetical protein
MFSSMKILLANAAAKTLNAPVGVGLYIMFSLIAALGAYLYTLRQETILSCPGTGYGAHRYLAYCFATQYGDYDHGAFWFDLEPKVRDLAASAEVLFLGSSRMQFGFSSDAAAQWFSTAAASYYLMGFAYWENYAFEWPLLKQITPRAKVYVIDLDKFFEQTETGPANVVMHDTGAYSRYQRKRVWQLPHRLLCSRLPSLCGNTEAFYRSIDTGAYTHTGGEDIQFPVTYDSKVDKKMVADYAERGAAFVSSIPVSRKCVLLTMVPGGSTDTGTAKALADALGLTLIAPQLRDLSTFDRSHLDRPSAERWSQAFLDAAAPRIHECLDASNVAAR